MTRIDKIRSDLNQVFDDNLHTKIWHNVFDWVIIGLILISSLEVFLSTFSGIAERYGHLLTFIDVFTTVVFTVEVSLRIWAADLLDPKYAGFKGRVKYCFSFYGMVDILSTYPALCGLFVRMPMSVLKILRVARLIRIFRYMASFRILGQAVESKKSELYISFTFLSILTVILSFLLYYAEHEAQPELCENGWDTLVWAFAKYLGDPGKIADFPLVTFWGHLIAALVGVLGIAIFAVPAGLIGSGFVEVIEERKNAEELRGNGERINEFFLVKSIKRNGIFFPAKNLPFGDINLDLGLTNDEILRAATACKNLRVKNLSAAISQGPKTDMLVVNQFPVNTSYGSHFERGSSVTIVNPLGTGDNGLSFFTWHIAELGGFNYVGNELFSRTKGDKEFRSNFYNPDEESVENGCFREFIDDIALERNDTDWIVVISGEQVVKDAETDFHFECGAPQKTEGLDFPSPLISDMGLLKRLYSDFSETLEQATGLKTDAHQVQPTLNKDNLCYYLKSKTGANILMINIAYRLMIFDKRVHSAMMSIAEVLGRNLETKQAPRLHTERYQTRPAGSEYWRNLML